MLSGDRRGLARLMSAVENGAGEIHRIASAIGPRLGRAQVLGVTGAPGVGKSTLVNAVVAELRRRKRTVGVMKPPTIGENTLRSIQPARGHSRRESV